MQLVHDVGNANAWRRCNFVMYIEWSYYAISYLLQWLHLKSNGTLWNDKIVDAKEAYVFDFFLATRLSVSRFLVHL